MPYFSRLTEIVTCNLTALLDGAEDKQATHEEIIQEIQEGITGAQRSVRTAHNNVARIECEISEQLVQTGEWMSKAREALENQELGRAPTTLAPLELAPHVGSAEGVSLKCFT